MNQVILVNIPDSKEALYIDGELGSGGQLDFPDQAA